MYPQSQTTYKNHCCLAQRDHTQRTVCGPATFSTRDTYTRRGCTRPGETERALSRSQPTHDTSHSHKTHHHETVESHTGTITTRKATGTRVMRARAQVYTM